MTEQIRDLTKLNPVVESLVKIAIRKADKKQIDVLVVETLRSKDRQMSLYCEGRTVAECVINGIPRNIALTYCNSTKRKVTFTLHSQHIQGCAVDLVPLIGGKAIFSNTNEQSKKVIEIMKSIGFVSGSEFKSVDSPHFELTDFTGDCLKKENSPKRVTVAIQKLLIKKGFYSGSSDGIWGDVTTTGVNKFVKANKGNPNDTLSTKFIEILFK